MEIKQVEKLIQNKHEEYQNNLPLWQKCYLAWRGGDDFKNTYLWPFEREDEEDYKQRLFRTSYENLFADIILRRQSLVFSRKINRSTNAPLKRINRNIDGMGTGRDEFVQKCFRLSQIFGFLPVIADRRTDENDQLPYLVPILPFNLINWGKDPNGEFDWILIKAKSESGDKDETHEVYHLYDREKTSIYKTKKKGKGLFSFSGNRLEKEEEFQHNLGTVPITILYDMKHDDSESSGKPSLKDSCELIIKMFNLSSWYDQLLYKTNYSTLAATPFHGSSDDLEIVVGAGDVFWVPEGSQMPQWIAPDTGPSEIFEKRLADIRRRIYELAGLDAGMKENSKNIISGEAFSYQRKPVEEMALRLATQLEEFENNIDRILINTWMGDDKFTPQIKYPESYSHKPLMECVREMESVDRINSIPLAAREFIIGRILTSGKIAELQENELEELKSILSRENIQKQQSSENNES